MFGYKKGIESSPEGSFSTSQTTPSSRANVDDLIRGIPFPEGAVSEFHSVRWKHSPYRDIPSILIAHIGNPNLTAQEPDWERLLQYFSLGSANNGFGNLQDLYVFLTRVVVPNAIIANRRLLIELYTARRTLSPHLHLRYDACPTFGGVPLTSELLMATVNTPPCAVMATVPTPNGADFLAWLDAVPFVPPELRPVPVQLRHRRSHLDGYMNEDERHVRKVVPGSLAKRTAKVFHIFWWLTFANKRLNQYKGVGWIDIEREVAW